MKPVFIRQMIYVAMILVVPIASYLLIFKARNAATVALDADAVKMSDKLGKIEKVMDGAKNNLSDHTSTLKQAIDKMSARRQPEKNLNDIYRALQRMAAGHGLEASYLTKAAGDRDAVEEFSSGFRRKQLAPMSLQGSFISFYAFLLELEKLEDMIYPTRIDISRAMKLTEEGQVVVRLECDYYYSTKQ